VSTLVLCVDRSDDVGRVSDFETPIVGWEAVQSLVTELGLVDPEDSSVNCILEALRVTRKLQDDDADPTVAVVSGGSGSLVGADRSLAAELDTLAERYSAESAIVVIDSANDEQVIPVIESRIRVDSVDRVVVRQAHDIQSTYYLLKQFLADEELRTTVLVPLGTTLLFLPILLIQFPPTIALAGLTALLGAVLLYKGLAIDQYLEEAPEQVQTALYSGRVSVVTYAVGAGLALVGVFLGALAIPTTVGADSVIVQSVQFIYSAIPWLALAALTVSAGRLLDEFIESERITTPYLNLPFGVVALGFVVRGFAGWFLQRETILTTPEVFNYVITPQQRLATFIIVGIIISIIGVRVAASVNNQTDDDLTQH
jgi:putative membrane protein